MKTRLSDSADPEAKNTVRSILVAVLDALLRLLQPMIPFVTEEVWQRLADFAPRRGLPPRRAAESVMIAPWPTLDEIPIPELTDPAFAAEIGDRFAQFQEVLRAVRDVRSRQNIPEDRDRLLGQVRRRDHRTAQADASLLQVDGRNRLRDLGHRHYPPPLSASAVAGKAEVYVDIADLIDLDAEIAKKEKEIAKLSVLVEAKEAKLRSSFVEKAHVAVVEKERGVSPSSVATRVESADPAGLKPPKGKIFGAHPRGVFHRNESRGPLLCLSNTPFCIAMPVRRPAAAPFRPAAARFSFRRSCRSGPAERSKGSSCVNSWKPVPRSSSETPIT